MKDFRLEHLRQILGDRYQVHGTLGRGAFATVYLVENLRLERKEALKVLSDLHEEGSSFSERFVEEAKLVASLDHPNIVKVYDYGDSAGTLWTSMQYIDGPSLRSELGEQERFETPTAIRLTLALLDALAYSHDEGIVHRDVKPSNILLNRRGEPFLMDFGIAKVARSTFKTMTGSVLGTPAYMAPEQAEGLPLDGRADLYALGTVLYEMLAGVPPYQGAEPIQILVKRLREDPAPLSAHLPDIDPGLEAVVAHALARQPEDRFPDAEAMRQALAHCLDNAAEHRFRPATRPELSPISMSEALTVHSATRSRSTAQGTDTGIDATRPTLRLSNEVGPRDSGSETSTLTSAIVAPEAPTVSESLPERGDRGHGGPQPTAPQPTAPQPTAPESQRSRTGGRVILVAIAIALLAGWWLGRGPSPAPSDVSSETSSPPTAADGVGREAEPSGSEPTEDPAVASDGAKIEEETAQGGEIIGAYEDARQADEGKADETETTSSTPPSPPPIAPPTAPPIRRAVVPPRIAEPAPLELDAEHAETCAGLSIIVSVRVGENGGASSLRALGEGPKPCVDAALATAEGYRFEPARDIEGAPVDAPITLSLRFDSP